MFRRFLGRRMPSPAGLFNGPFFDVRTLFVLEFDCLPSVCAVGDLDGDRALVFLRERIASQVIKTWQHSFFEYDEGTVCFARSIYLLPGRRMVEVGAGYVELLHDGDFSWANALVTELARFRQVQKEAPIGFARSGSMN
ncbi:hypothetical protein EPD60_09015 [Flaviaesturariibacter flavus]|uniref:Uncharacterized protein n=1 Tax=Flaviaesturariibacter flavus TaxID=2502780 RepID=A0A4R1BB16_9BACT|nr:hypothetical protein [Flaviaesturariibacter flavus]TCJ14137.1 hypothetical protein EPD60_09015 [Flaviaesturariibacter flavus]